MCSMTVSPALEWKVQWVSSLWAMLSLPDVPGSWKVEQFQVNHEMQETLFVLVNPNHAPLLFRYAGGQYSFIEPLRRLTEEERIKREEMQTPVEGVDALDLKIQRQGGFSTNLKYSDLLKLRAIVKKVHMAKYPEDMITDHEADRIIDVMAPATQEYLIKKHLEGAT